MGVANILDDNLVYYLLFQFSGIGSTEKKEEVNKKQCSVENELVFR